MVSKSQKIINYINFNNTEKRGTSSEIDSIDVNYEIFTKAEAHKWLNLPTVRMAHTDKKRN